MVADLTARAGDAARPDPLVAAAVAWLEREPAAARVGALGPAVGLGERQLRRRFLAGVGYGPKCTRLAGGSPATLLVRR